MSSNEIDVTKVDSWADVTVTVDLDPATTPDMKVQYLDRRMQPRYVRAEYRMDAATGRWVCQYVTVAGLRLLKPAPDGSPRLGKDSHKASFGGWRKDVQADNGLPGWLDQLVDELRPSGRVSLPGVG